MPAPNLAFAVFAGIALSFAVLTWGYVTSDFSILNVWENSNSQQPLLFKFTGVWGNYLKASIEAQGMDPNNLERSDPSNMNFGADREKPKSWKEIWGAGQGIGAVKDVRPAAEVVERMATEYAAARKRLFDQTA